MRDFRSLVRACFLVLPFLLPSHLVAQQDSDDSYADLKRQIGELQAKLDKATTKKQSNDAFAKDGRVRDVGRQIIRRRTQEDNNDIALQIRLYDLSDLFAVSPNYPAQLPNELEPGSSLFADSPAQHRGSGGGGFGGGGAGGGGVFCYAPTATRPTPTPGDNGNLNMQSAQVTLKQLVSTIKETVKPEMWGQNETSARVKFLGNTLLITATEDMHSQINNLLNLFREHWGKRRTISIQAYWVRAAPGAAEDLLDADATAKIGAGVVLQEKWSAFFSKARTDKNVVYSATLTGHNNQTLHALSGRQVRLTVDAEPFKEASQTLMAKDLKQLPRGNNHEDHEDEDNPFGDDEDLDRVHILKRSRRIIGFAPIQTTFHNGAVIQVTPLATRGGNFVILDLQAKINELVDGKNTGNKERIFLDEAEKKHEVQLDNLDFVSCRFSSTLRCPKDKVILAGSMTFDPSETEENPEVYLFVKASVHTIEEDQSDRKQGKVIDPKKANSKAD